MFLTMFSKTQNIAQTMILMMLISHQYRNLGRNITHGKQKVSYEQHTSNVKLCFNMWVVTTLQLLRVRLQIALFSYSYIASAAD